ncbi:diaminopimelate decarboxylase [Myroides guanonis]|uniref:Diaminopimelate decarboxylase n=1 Tax=Myroides guanonis TaxID=1150112 RepID=A0A1I3UGK8_9FLAO|nr:diaminopimelate decarboxylase [Myroides guanonis]SFJ80941.1 diaminopimelate decarboxylase [Myroides guanonis]
MFTIENIKALEKLSTPAYVYDLPLLRKNISVALNESKKYGYKIHYAIKANNNPRILEEIQKLGLGADCVSGQEIDLAVRSGFKTNEIVFAGVGKTDKEIQTALKHQIFAFNVESVQELEVIGEWALVLKLPASIALRINPNVDAKTHHYITTGLDENKFGVLSHELDRCLEIIKENEYLNFKGLHFHVGSQIMDLSVFRRLCLKVNEWNEWFYERGVEVPVLNLGGGLGVNYEKADEEAIAEFEAFFAIFNQFLEPKEHQEIHFELGRSLVASCGSLLSRVLYIKNGLKKNFAILDAGMTELLRPALYQAFHKIECLDERESDNMVSYDVVGPICESSDCFGKEVLLPELKRGSLMAIRTAGAYGEVMSSRYNLREELTFYFKE